MQLLIWIEGQGRRLAWDSRSLPLDRGRCDGYTKGELKLEKRKKENRERVAADATRSATAPHGSPSARASPSILQPLCC